MSKIHTWNRMAMLGLIQVKCGRMVKANQFTNDSKQVTCKACLNQMKEKP